MASNWKTIKLGELVDFTPKRTIKKGTIAPFVSMADIPENLKYIPEIFEKEYKSGGSRFKNGDTVFARITPCLQNGKTAKVTGLEEDDVAHGSTEFIVFASKEPAYDEEFIYYLSRDPEFRAYAESRMEGSTGRQRVSWQALADYEFEAPEKDVRKSIGSFLSSFDEKIELNRQTNQTLEQMAQALFKSWFVDFDPVFDNALASGMAVNDFPEALQKKALSRQQQRQQVQQQIANGELDAKPLPEDIQQLFPSEFEQSDDPKIGFSGWIPEGWKSSSLGEKVTVKRGGSPRPIKDFIVPEGLPWTKISDATASNSRFIKKTKEFIKPEGLSKTTLLKKGTLILSNSATPGLPKFLDLDACVHDGWLHFPVKDTFTDLYLYQLFLVVRKQLVQQGNGSVFTNLKTDILKDHKVVVPNASTLLKFDELMTDFNKKLHEISESTATLERTRDTLLPKLISGEISLPESKVSMET